ncbi:MAG: DUF434 domain-containing protein [Candidatus Methanomethylicus sp.]|nr:DUF434 domain-containing protein [Candidatus Methanomethylicus sp.]
MSLAAIEEVRYLLGRGYRRESAVRFVGDRYVLDKPQRMMLYRCVCPLEVSKERKNKIVSADVLPKHNLSIDGFNVLWTVNSALRDRPIYMSDDFIVRDISIQKGEPSVDELSEAIALTINAISILHPLKIFFFFDRPISHSGEVASEIARLLSKRSLPGCSQTSPNTDMDVLRLDGVVATSDSIIIDKALMVFDLGAYVIGKFLRIDPIKI